MAETRAELNDRLRREGRAEEAAKFREVVRSECRKAGMTKAAAGEHAWLELARNFSPIPSPAPEIPSPDASVDAGEVDPPDREPGDKLGSSAASMLSAPRGRVTGLDAIPPTWPSLPASAALAAELAWCQSNRLQVVTETPTSVKVDLSRAGEPAPSRSALAWLETAIRNFAKFTDVLSKVAAGGTDEADEVRRERVALYEIERLLEEMIQK